MSKDSHIKAYIVGFILSLIFTAIPYYLVVTQTMKGRWLLGAILGFAVLQMLVQIIFFLHLGRNPKLRWQIGFFVATVGAILVVTVGSVVIMSHLHGNMMPKDIADKAAGDEAVYQIDGEQIGTCSAFGANHKIVLKKDELVPRHTKARLCDTITIVNESDMTRAIMFGTHEQLETYAGESGETIRSGRNQQFTLTEPGTHQFHDHSNHEVGGDFTVTP